MASGALVALYATGSLPGGFYRPSQSDIDAVLIVARSTPLESMSATACVNTILMHPGRYLRIARGVIEFNKHKLVSTYLSNDPPLMLLRCVPR